MIKIKNSDIDNMDFILKKIKEDKNIILNGMPVVIDKDIEEDYKIIYK